MSADRVPPITSTNFHSTHSITGGRNGRTTNTREQLAHPDSPNMDLNISSRPSHYKFSVDDATTDDRDTEDPIYDQIDINPYESQIQETSKKPDLDRYIAMILQAGKESHAGATYQTRDFSAVCIDERGGVISLDYYDVTLLLPPLSLHEPCVTIFLYMERMIVKRVHGNPRYASPVIRVGCISKNKSTRPFQENAVLSLPLFDWTDNQYILPFQQQDASFIEGWTGLSAEENTFINDGLRCTISIDKTGLYACLNYTRSDIIASDRGRRVLPVQCSAFVGRLSTEDVRVRVEVAFWLSSESQSARVVQRQHAGQMNCFDGSRELLLDISHMALNKALVVDVTGICEGWTVYGGKQKHIPLSTIRDELKSSDSLYTIEFKFNRNQSYEVDLSCKLRTYIKDHGGDKQKLSLFRYNCMRKRSTLDWTDEKSENRGTIAYQRDSNNSRDILDIIDRCLAHVTKIISSDLNGVWEKRFAESLNIPTSQVESAEEIFLINKGLYVFVGSRIGTMTDNDIVLDFITASNTIYKELENEAMKKRRNHTAKSRSLPHGAKLMTKSKYNRSASCSTDVGSDHRWRLVTPLPRRQSLPYRCHSENATDVCSDEKYADDSSSSQGMLTVHNEDDLL